MSAVASFESALIVMISPEKCYRSKSDGFSPEWLSKTKYDTEQFVMANHQAYE